MLACSCGASVEQRAVTRPATPVAAAASEPCSGASTAAAPSAGAETNCRPFLRQKLAATEAKLRQAYRPIYGDSRVIVDFPCNVIEQINQIDIEVGDRRSRKLTLLRFTHAADGGYHVVGIEVQGPNVVEQAQASQPEQLEVKAVAFDPGAAALDFEDVRTPLMATINEVRFKDRLPSVDGFTGPEIRYLVSVAGVSGQPVGRPDSQGDLAARHFERSYTGEADSIAQKEYVPLQLASAPLLALVAAKTDGAAITDEHRRFFAERFAATVPRAPSWLRELFEGVANQLGAQSRTRSE